MKLLDTNIVFAVRCANCGKIEFHNISLFELPVGSRAELSCSCGSASAVVSMKPNRNISIVMECIACEISHTYTYRINDILRKRLTVVCCGETGLELCFLGRDKDVKDMVSKYQEDLNLLLCELGLFQEFDDSIPNLKKHNR